jgi:hypothetical protein
MRRGSNHNAAPISGECDRKPAFVAGLFPKDVTSCLYLSGKEGGGTITIKECEKKLFHKF